MLLTARLVTGHQGPASEVGAARQEEEHLEPRRRSIGAEGVGHGDGETIIGLEPDANPGDVDL